MKLLLSRVTLLPERTLGTLYVNGEFFCFTLEDRKREEGVKVKDETCIPAGTYSITQHYSPKFERVMPMLENVPNFSYIYIHPGNDESDTSGCILVGFSLQQKIGKPLGSSRVAFDQLMLMMDKALEAKESIEITITNPKEA